MWLKGKEKKEETVKKAAEKAGIRCNGHGGNRPIPANAILRPQSLPTRVPGDSVFVYSPARDEVRVLCQGCRFV